MRRLADLSWRRQKIRLIAMGCLLLATIVNTSCANTATFDRQLDSITGPYKFSIALWELNAIPRAVYEVVSNNRASVDDEVETVMRYFSITGQISRLELEINSASGEEGLAALQCAEKILASVKKNEWTEKINKNI